VKYLLDTNVVSELRKQKPHGAVVTWLHGISNDDIFVSAVTLGELQAGVEITRAQDPTKAAEIELWIESVANNYQVLSMDAACFREWARIMHGMPDQLMLDAMIAAIARVHGLTVATRNVRDIARFTLKVVNPFTS
jgi:predicted nucleic acid-binding protein